MKAPRNPAGIALDLSGQVAVVTGGSRGIGRAIAILLAEAGARVAIGYRRNTRAAVAVVDRIRAHGGEAVALRGDLACRGDCEALVRVARRKWRRLDILVHSGGVWTTAAADRMPARVLAETVETNLESCFHLVRAVAPGMKRRGAGQIVLISSTAGQRGEAFHSHYAATKGAVIALTKSLAVEFAPHGIRVNCVAPGRVSTDMTAAALRGAPGRRVAAGIPLGRVGRPEEIAGAVLFCVSPLASFITGEVLNVNGGAVLCG